MDMGHPVMAIIPVAVATATLTLVAWQDWRYRRIPNLAVFALLLCALVRWSQFSGVELERIIEVHGINVLLALFIAIPGTMKSILGVGDTKLLLALALLWPTDLFLQAFSIGILALLAGCILYDTLKPRRYPALTGNVSAPSATVITELKHRGLPLGTALALGALLSTAI